MLWARHRFESNILWIACCALWLCLSPGAARAEAPPIESEPPMASPTPPPAAHSPALALDPLEERNVPEPLRPWTSWALRGRETTRCPKLEAQPLCAWPSTLTLAVDDRGGRFEQRWHVEARGWVPLPGDTKRWPLSVTINQKRAVVVARDGVPSALLDPGDYTLVGTFAWDSPPESLKIPAHTGLLALSLRGKTIPQPLRDADGTLWLQKTVSEQDGERLEFVVHRKLDDEVPLLLTTRISLSVSGRSREVLLGKALPAGFAPMALESQLPARVEADSRLRVQLRPGDWTITLSARSQGPTAEVSRPAPDGPWREGEEIWVFSAKPELRVVEIEGANAIDPQQTSLPDDWKQLPAYPMGPTTKLRLVEKQRGIGQVQFEGLSLKRILWLDFDGGGFTAADTVSGSLNQPARLEALAPLQLGRVALGGGNQFITTLPGQDGRAGVALAAGPLNLNADSRLEAKPSDLPALGYDHDFKQVSAQLHLPPGYRLVHARGVDRVQATWVDHWTLLEIFWVLVLSVTVFRLHGPRWAALALIAFALLFPEHGAPKYIFLGVLFCEALVRGVKLMSARAPSPSRGLARLTTALRGAWALSLVILALISISFMIEHVRAGLFPVLADTNQYNTRYKGDGGSFGRAEQEAVAMAVEEAMPSEAPVPEPSIVQKRKPSSPRQSANNMRQYKTESYDPSIVVQTGPGRPSWDYGTINLSWSGPVERSQRLHLHLLSPLHNSLLALVRAALLLALFWQLAGRLRGAVRWLSASATTAAGVLALLLGVPSLAQAQAPSQALLDELAERLTAPPSCAPSCASSSRLLIETSPSELRLVFEVDAAAKTAVALPTGAQWMPSSVTLDGAPAKALARDDDGQLQIAVEAGPHTIVLSGPVGDRELVQLPLPLKPHRVEVRGEAFRVDGLHEDGLADDNLQLTRLRTKDDTAAIEQTELPPLVRVERRLSIGLEWKVETQVVRLSPKGAPIVLEIPLLPGEQVTTADVRVSQGKVQINLDPQATVFNWASALAPKSPLDLQALTTPNTTELWRAQTSSMWHLESEGVPAGGADALGVWWQPWPGEALQLRIAKPEGVPGRSLTIDQSHYELSPGLRVTNATLKLTVRASRGTQHTVRLPEGAVLESVTIGGARTPVRQEGPNVIVPIAPGTQEITLTWHQPTGISALYRPPSVGLGTHNVNAKISVNLTADRWVLFLGGPRIGPVVLFWSFLGVMLIAAFALGRLRQTPLRGWQWMLLVIGLSQIHIVGAALIVGWLHFVAWRERRPELGRHWFNLRQLVMVLATFVALLLLLFSVHEGLLGTPDMQVTGNHSSGAHLHWFEDRNDGDPSQVTVLSAPIWIYRVVMLAWALWLALSVVSWLRWAFRAFGHGGFWMGAPQPLVAYPNQGQGGPPPAAAPPAAPTHGEPPAP